MTNPDSLSACPLGLRSHSVLENGALSSFMVAAAMPARPMIYRGTNLSREPSTLTPSPMKGASRNPPPMDALPKAKRGHLTLAGVPPPFRVAGPRLPPGGRRRVITLKLYPAVSPTP